MSGKDILVRKTTDGLSGAADNHYGYDLANRLTSWDDGSTITAYSYDKSGNRLQNGSRLFTYDERNRLLTADGYGYTYTARGTLEESNTAAGPTTTSVDAFGQVISQQYDGGSQTYEYDGLGRVVEPGFAYTGLGNNLAGDATADYVRDPAGDLLATDVGWVGLCLDGSAHGCGGPVHGRWHECVGVHRLRSAG